jgi:LacI family transcriptional regulator
MVTQVRHQGARRLAYVDGSATDCGDRRRAGFLAAAADLSCRVLPGAFSLTAGRQAGIALARDLPDAILCASDHLALGVIMGLRHAGVRVPEDVLVTGADNIPLAEVAHPALTTYDQMSAQCGRLCTEMLLARVTAGTPLGTHVLPPTIHRRESA